MTKFKEEHALKVLRPTIADWVEQGSPTKDQIKQKVKEMNDLSDAEKKGLRRLVSKPNPHDLLDMIDDLTDRITALENKGKSK